MLRIKFKISQINSIETGLVKQTDQTIFIILFI